VKIIHKRQGLQRWLQQNLGLNATSTSAKAIAVLLCSFVPGIVVGHMILAVARKPAA
jgi:F0F1-type ATP synthase membrane subunit c/vacuolar-type H+-ATPase subunit K